MELINKSCQNISQKLADSKQALSDVRRYPELSTHETDFDFGHAASFNHLNDSRDLNPKLYR